MKHKSNETIVSLLLIIILVIIDQLTKHMAVIKLKDGNPFVLLDNIFQLKYLENTGAAFGIFSGQKILIVVTTFIILICLIIVYFKIPKAKIYLPLRLITVFLCAGAIGNMIDRVLYNYVIDFFYFNLINFPIFNVADCYVTLSVFLLFLLIIFYYKEDDLNFLFPSKK